MYNYKEIEEKWQKYWDKNNIFKVDNKGDKPYYILVEYRIIYV